MQKDLEGIDIIIIDESSFIGIKAICILDYVLRKISNIDSKMGNFKVLYYGDFCQLNCVKDFDIFKPRSTEEIEKILNEGWEDLEEFDENEQGFDNNDNVDIDIMEAIREMGGIKVNLDQNAEKVC